MPKKGVSNNPNGRPKGAKNKLGTELRETIADFLEGNFETIRADFKKLAPKDRVKFYCDLLNYGLPKLQATTMDIQLDRLSEEDLDEVVQRLKNSS